MDDGITAECRNLRSVFGEQGSIGRTENQQRSSQEDGQGYPGQIYLETTKSLS